MRRITAALSVTLLVLVSVAVAEGALLVMLLVFGSVLRVYLGVELGEHALQLFSPNYPAVPNVAIRHAGIAGSIVFTFACGAAATAWRYRRWTPA